jgi:hypothetical protein
MAWSDLTASVNAACASVFGEAATFAGQAVTVILGRTYDPVLQGGQVIVSEDHYQGQIQAGDLSADPAMGDILTTAAGTEYRVDLPPELREGMWILTLRRLD